MLTWAAGQHTVDDARIGQVYQWRPLAAAGPGAVRPRCLRGRSACVIHVRATSLLSVWVGFACQGVHAGLERDPARHALIISTPLTDHAVIAPQLHTPVSLVSLAVAFIMIPQSLPGRRCAGGDFFQLDGLARALSPSLSPSLTLAIFNAVTAVRARRTNRSYHFRCPCSTREPSAKISNVLLTHARFS
jgi:hypothetical protein